MYYCTCSRSGILWGIKPCSLQCFLIIYVNGGTSLKQFSCVIVMIISNQRGNSCVVKCMLFGDGE